MLVVVQLWTTVTEVTLGFLPAKQPYLEVPITLYQKVCLKYCQLWQCSKSKFNYMKNEALEEFVGEYKN
ncbi:hypothetical protein CRI83_04870 [Liquorilactobacillus nagelii]|jgi:hypothetical protein|uniref:Uncharacterized protein n=1 Tax=Liquorilactobacillus nagelii TaxID=82688 RepID=A0A3S6QU94_9LACO|nr:hypothetical protein BSQ50_03085 [Liquorilactobacillus nagelii]MCC7616004.1 hypothetical protein [Liquorilactobacillus nagelii]